MAGEFTRVSFISKRQPLTQKMSNTSLKNVHFSAEILSAQWELNVSNRLIETWY